MKKWWFLVIWIGITGLVGGSMWKIEPDVDQINSPTPKIFEKTPTHTPTPKPNKITIAAVGDIGLGREINYQILQRNNPLFPFEKVKEFLTSADITIGNLEGPVIDNCPTTRSGFRFCGRLENVQGLVSAGFDGINLANNHINNYGLEGLTQTTAQLQKNNINYFFEDKVWFKEIGQTKTGFLGFDDTIQKINNYELQVMIEKAKEKADIIVVNFHWGEEYQLEPNVRQKDLAKLAIDAGADIVIGHHPHVIQPLKYYQGKPIFYSLGNFVFDQMWSEETKTGAIGLITIENKQIVKTDIQKVYMESCCQPKLVK